MWIPRKCSSKLSDNLFQVVLCHGNHGFNKYVAISTSKAQYNEATKVRQELVLKKFMEELGLIVSRRTDKIFSKNQRLSISLGILLSIHEL